MSVYFLVYSNPTAGMEEEYNEWYSNIHLPEVVALEGFKSAQRLQLTKEQMVAEQPFKYLALYELEGSDVKAAQKALLNGFATMNMSSTIDLANVHIAIFETITDIVRGRKSGFPA